MGARTARARTARARARARRARARLPLKPKPRTPGASWREPARRPHLLIPMTTSEVSAPRHLLNSMIVRTVVNLTAFHSGQLSVPQYVQMLQYGAMRGLWSLMEPSATEGHEKCQGLRLVLLTC